MEIQATTTGNAAQTTAEQSMQVLQVLLELVHPQGGTVQISQESDNIEIQSDAEQLQNVTSLHNDLGGEDIVITYDSVSGEINSIQNPITNQQHDVIQVQEGSIYGSQLNTENVIFEVTDRQPETVEIPTTSTSSVSASAEPQSSIVEIPVLKPLVLGKNNTKEKSQKSMEAREQQYQFECTLCQKLCKSKQSLEKHIRKELKMKPHVCDLCKKRFKNLTGLQNHQKLHTGEKPYKCEACDISFANRSTYNYHQELKHSDNVYVCQCSKKFKTKACLRAHLKNHTAQGPKRYKCQYCGLRLKTKHYKQEHERIHTNERPFKCRYVPCEKTFRRSGARNDHERTVHLKVNKEICKYCGHLYDKREMKNHELVHTGEKPFQCPYCESKYTQRKVLNKHIRRKHPEKEVPQPPPKEKVQKYETLVMDASSIKSAGTTNTSVKSSKRKSKKSKSKAVASAPAPDESAPSTIQIQVFRCMYCVKLFNNVAHLTEHEKTHIKMHHFECSICGKTFQRPEGLTRHQGKHAGGFSCDKCGSVFNTLTKMQEHHREHFLKCAHCKHNFQSQDKLDEHMAEKHGPNPSDTSPSTGYECKYCQKSFLRKVGLKEHERIHLERVKCPLCEKVFVSYYLPKHLRTHSGDHPYTCSLCPNRHYTTPNALRTHMRRRHPVQKIKIKHKKGVEGATIQVSEAPHQVHFATAEVSDTLESTTVEGMQVSYQMESIKEEAAKATQLSIGDATSTMTVQPTTSISNSIPMTSKFVMPIEMSGVIQQAAAVNNIQMTPIVSQEQVTRLVQGQDGTYTTIHTIPRTDQESIHMTSVGIQEQVSQLVAQNGATIITIPADQQMNTTSSVAETGQENNAQMMEVVSQAQVSQIVGQNSATIMTLPANQQMSTIAVAESAEQGANIQLMRVVSREQVSQMVGQNNDTDITTIPADQQQILTETTQETLVISQEQVSQMIGQDKMVGQNNDTDITTIPADQQQILTETTQETLVISQEQVSQMIGQDKMVGQSNDTDITTIPADQQQILTETTQETLVISQDQVSQMIGQDTIVSTINTSSDETSQPEAVNEMGNSDSVNLEDGDGASQEPVEEAMETDSGGNEDGKQQVVFAYT